jgi:L-fuculose-phosphate aldolase
VVDASTLAHKGNIKPSSELGIHAAAYQHDLGTNFVVHTHQAAAGAISATGSTGLAALNLSPSEQAALGKIGLASYGLPGSEKLARNVTAVIADNKHTILLERHGALLIAGSSDQAFERAVLLEQLCARALPEFAPNTELALTTVERDGGVKSTDPLLQHVLAEQPAIHRRGDHWSPVLPLLQRVLAEQPAIQVVQLYASAVVEVAANTALARNQHQVWAMLDDFAQMVGDSLPIIAASEPADIAAAFSSVGCVFVVGRGLVCAAAEAGDCEALNSIAQKNALAFLAAEHYGGSGSAEPLPLSDRLIMRQTYLQSYSKLK